MPPIYFFEPDGTRLSWVTNVGIRDADADHRPLHWNEIVSTTIQGNRPASLFALMLLRLLNP